jgi:hypothetical protein
MEGRSPESRSAYRERQVRGGIVEWLSATAVGFQTVLRTSGWLGVNGTVWAMGIVTPRRAISFLSGGMV